MGHLALVIFLSLLSAPALTAEASPFNYFGAGADWVKSYPACGGSKQSPINIVTEAADRSRTTDSLVIMPASNPRKIGYEIGLTILSSGNWEYLSNVWNGKELRFTNANIHVHAPSEHTINGVTADAEVHLVHRLSHPSNDPIQFGVLTFLFKKGAGKPSPFLSTWDFTAGPKNNFVLSNAVTAEIQQSKGYYTYEGSLTTPPCTEAVRFFILDTIFDISDDQLKALNDKFKNNQAFANGFGNNRPVQNLNGRTVYYQAFANSTAAVIPMNIPESSTRLLTAIIVALLGFLTS